MDQTGSNLPLMAATSRARSHKSVCAHCELSNETVPAATASPSPSPLTCGGWPLGLLPISVSHPHPITPSSLQVTFKSTNGNIEAETEKAAPAEDPGFLEEIRRLLETNLVEEGGKVMNNWWNSLPRLALG